MLCLGVLGCKNVKDDLHKSQYRSNISESISANDKKKYTFEVDYAYWWSQTGPFLGYCGDEYSLVFLGTVVDLRPSIKKQDYFSQKGIIRVDTILTSKALDKNKYKGEEIVITESFYQTKVEEEDQVLVFCYDYEGNYVTPGFKSILIVNGLQDTKVQSIMKYIKSDQNPMSIEDDILIWDKVALGSDLRQIISCKKILSVQ